MYTSKVTEQLRHRVGQAARITGDVLPSGAMGATKVIELGIAKAAIAVPVVGIAATATEGAVDLWRSRKRLRRAAGEGKSIHKKDAFLNGLGILARYGVPITALVVSMATGIGWIPLAYGAFVVAETAWDMRGAIGRRLPR